MAKMTVEESIALAKSEIRADIASGRVPESVASFAELHDYVDANEYGALCGRVYEELRGDGDDMPVELTSFADAVQNAVDRWLRNGMQEDPAPDAECPEWCSHGGRCAEDRAAISRAERYAEDGWLRAAEAGYPGYDFDPNDPRSMDR